MTVQAPNWVDNIGLRDVRTTLIFDAHKAKTNPAECVRWLIEDGQHGGALQDIPTGTLASVALSMRSVLSDVEGVLESRGLHWQPTKTPDNKELPIPGEYRRIRMESA